MPSQPLDATHGSSSKEDQAIDPTAESTGDDDDDEDVEAEDWTQIPGPADEEMSNSDDSSILDEVHYRVPSEVRKAEQDASLQSPDIHTVPDIHGRYTGFSLLLCRETATEDADQYVSDGLELAITTAKSIRLDVETTKDSELDLYAFALVIHIWQIICLRKQHGTFPSEVMEECLCLMWDAYFLSAHSILERLCSVPLSQLRSAVQYWEDRLKSSGGGNRWMKDRWAKDIPQDDLEARVPRNETADGYLAALDRHGKTGLALRIIEEEKKGEATQLRAMTLEPGDGVRETCRQMAYMLYSMKTSVIIAIIQGQLPRLAEVASGEVCQSLQELRNREYIQPGTYMNCVCDHMGMSPTPAQWNKVCTLMIKYVQGDDEYNDLAEVVDQQIHPKRNWPKDLAHKGLRRYTEWQSYEKGSNYPDSVYRKRVEYFVDQLKKRMEGQPIHAPLSVPVIEIGFSNDPYTRLKQHRHHESSNYLMNLAEAAFETEFPGAFRLQQRTIYACFRPIQTWLSEIVLTQLAQGYVEGGGGFSHEVAGRSNGVSKKVIWEVFEANVYADGKFKQEIEARISFRDERNKAEAEARERAQSLQAAREQHRINTNALKAANARLRAARDKLYR